ncbi:MAG: molecular chaperone HtpG [Flavobacteriaceae bacterium]|nr:molecular chaperone HtpG [Flavobacteriaceae bacterium]
MSKGNINISTENIFPIIKKFLYSDHEIFLRELISNATDATLKLKHLLSIGEAKGEFGNPIIEIKIDKKKKTLHIIDQGIGMTEEEVKKYINEIAFSGAEEFVNKYKDKLGETGIIGHFGLGFYSAFMVSEKVEIITKSHLEGSQAVRWECDGSPEYTLEPTEKEAHGTEIILHIDKDSKEFLEESRINELLRKYNRFMPIPIKHGTKEEYVSVGEGDEKKEEKITVDNIVNNPNPAWTKKPSDLKDEDYKDFYRELYPMQFEDPLFHIHLNVDHPFHLTGILFFPKITKNIDIQKDRIQLYQNQVFVTDNVEGIVPEFLQMLRGVIDSPDIPLNVSRSYLQADGAVKKIKDHITKKVADKLASLFKNERESFEQKWDDIKVIIEYGMLSEEKFYDKAKGFALYPTIDKKYFTFDELKEKVKDLQTDKDGNLVLLYAADEAKQHSFIEKAQAKGYEVLLMNSPIVSHLLQKLESDNEKTKFARVDADFVDNLIKKDDTKISKLSDEEKTKLEGIVKEIVPVSTYSVQMEALDSDEAPFIITQPEFMRRYKEMSMTGGGMMGFGDFPDSYNLVVNTNHPLMDKILNDSEHNKDYVNQALDLAKLSQNLLTGKDLTDFVKRSFELMK